MEFYNIILLSNGLCMCSCPSEEKALNRLKEIEDNDKWLADYYNWDKLPKYAIIQKDSMFLTGFEYKKYI